VENIITAVDSSVLWALVNNEPTCNAWTELLAHAASEGPLIVCPVVFAELGPANSSAEVLLQWLGGYGIEYSGIEPASAHLAGETFERYRAAGGPRNHLIPDFLIASHATLQAHRLATNDTGFQRQWFPGLPLLRLPARAAKPD
jgi:predicted nucleic acid-binding protein